MISLLTGGVPHSILDGGGTPSSLGWGLPHPVLDQGSTPSSLGSEGGGVLHPILSWSWMGNPPCPDLGWGTSTSHLDPGHGTPPSSRPGIRYPPHPRKCGQTENITFRHPSDAGGNNYTSSDYFTVQLIGTAYLESNHCDYGWGIFFWWSSFSEMACFSNLSKIGKCNDAYLLIWPILNNQWLWWTKIYDSPLHTTAYLI